MKPKGPVWKLPQYSLKLVRERTVSYPVSTGASLEPPRCASDATDVARLLHAMLDDADREKVISIYLSGTNVITGVEVAAIGGLHGCALAPRDILRGAILARASSFVMGHNHPSGDPTPSAEDIELTRLVRAAGRLIGTPLVDHVIVSPNGRHSSMYEQGLVFNEPVKDSQ